jgi:hypothetical protein
MTAFRSDLMTRMRKFGGVVLGMVVALAVLAMGRPEARAAGPSVMVYKAPTCGCCKKWMDHLEANGFTVQHEDMADVSPMKEELGVRKLVSCHTAVVAGYVIEGHVGSGHSATLREKPKVSPVHARDAGRARDICDDPTPAFDAKGTAAGRHWPQAGYCNERGGVRRRTPPLLHARPIVPTVVRSGSGPPSTPPGSPGC